MLRFLTASIALPLFAEVHHLTMRETLARVVRQNPDIAMARLEEQSAQHAVQQARDPFTPRIAVGSGLAKTFGFPMSIEGSAPSILQANASQFLFNRPQTYAVAQAKESVRTASIGVLAKREEMVWRAANLFLDAERAERVRQIAVRELESLQTVERTVRAAVSEGRELELAAKRAALGVARARQAVGALEAERDSAETNLALALGLDPEDRVRPAGEGRTPPSLPLSEEEAVNSALESNKELKRLESQIAVKELEIRGEKAARLPRVDLVAQYGLFAKFNNYEDYFRTFQRHNGQLGVSFQLPILTGPGVDAAVGRRRADIQRLRVELSGARGRISAGLRAAYGDVRKAEAAREVARLDLDVAREQVSVNLALMEEGRITLRQMEESRVAESDKWIAFYDAEYMLERTRLAVLHRTGELAASLTP
jgi:outer membrane protein TolC